MPRLPGQIDLSKNEAILDAAIEVLAERGASASMEQIARRARVSKQTIYNHYGSRAELVRALCERRVDEMSAPLDAPGAALDPKAALVEYAGALLRGLLQPRRVAVLRMAMAAAATFPEVASAFYEAGSRAARVRLAEFLRRETEAGRLACPDPLEAAEFFAGMALGSYQTAALLGVERVDEARIERIAGEAAARFLKAYAPG